MIVLTGATGTVGSAVLRRLAEDGVAVRALVRSETSRAAIERQGVEAVAADIDRPETLAPALAGGDRLFLLSPPHPRQVERETAVVDAAVSAGVSHVVALSAMGADRSAAFAFGRWHAAIDEHIAGSGLDHTILRPAVFMQTHLWPVATIRGDGRWYGMTGDGATAFVDVDDIAAAAAAALTGATEGRSVVELTGPAAISMPEAARVLAGVIQRPVSYVDMPAEQYRASRTGASLPEWLADALVELYGVIRAGHAATVTNWVERLAGRPARDYRAFAEAHKSDMVDSPSSASRS